MNLTTIATSGGRYLQRLVLAILGTDPQHAKPAINHSPSAGIKPIESEQPVPEGATTGAPVQATRKRPKRQRPPIVEVLPLEQRRWLTVKETSARFPCFSEKSLRHLIAQAEAYAKYPKDGLVSNGLIGCICRPAGQRKILIDAAKFETWLTAGAVGVSATEPANAR